MTSSVLAAVLVACLLAVVLVAMFVRMQRERPKREESDISGNPLFLSSTSLGDVSFGPSTGVAMTKMDALVPVTPNRGDRLWAEFRRCIAFDHMYFGNKLMALEDKALEDVYAILAVTCPVRSFFGPLRQVGARFSGQVVSKNNTQNHEMIIDDIVDFLATAMPDVLVERAIDMCATMQTKNTTEEAIYSQLIDEYVPQDNEYLAPSGGGLGLKSDAAQRLLCQVDPLYHMPSREDSDIYSNVAEYAMGGEFDDEDGPLYDDGCCDGVMNPSTYDFGHGDAAVYSMGAMGSDPDAVYSQGNYGRKHAVEAVRDENIYGMASGGGSGDGGARVGADYAAAAAGRRHSEIAVTYAMGDGGGEYLDSNPVFEATYGVAAATPAEATYGVAAATPANDAPTYGIASGHSASEPLYGIANARGSEGGYANPNAADGDYDNGNNVDAQQGEAVDNVYAMGDAEDDSMQPQTEGYTDIVTTNEEGQYDLGDRSDSYRRANPDNVYELGDGQN
jgi:hypothetical protein